MIGPLLWVGAKVLKQACRPEQIKYCAAHRTCEIQGSKSEACEEKRVSQGQSRVDASSFSTGVILLLSSSQRKANQGRKQHRDFRICFLRCYFSARLWVVTNSFLFFSYIIIIIFWKQREKKAQYKPLFFSHKWMNENPAIASISHHWLSCP